MNKYLDKPQNDIRPIWEQLEGESAKWFARFLLYRDMDATNRSLLGAYRINQQLAGKPSTKYVSSAWKRSFTRYNWQLRAEQYDNNQRNLNKVTVLVGPKLNGNFAKINVQWGGQGKNPPEINFLGSDQTHYDIYVLYDDTNGIVHYVGISNDVLKRYKQHCSCRGTNLELNLWIQDLLRANRKPSIATVASTVGYNTAQQLELLYIALYQGAGMPLKNIIGIQR